MSGPGTMVAEAADPPDPARPARSAVAGETTGRRRTFGRVAGRVAAFGAVVGVVVLFRDQLPAPSEVWELITGANPAWLAAAVVAEAAAMRTFAGLLRHLLVTSGIHLSMPRAVAVTYARNAVSSSLPGGQILSVAYTTRQFRRLGAPPAVIAATLVLTSVFSTLTFLALGVVALLAEPATRTTAMLGFAAAGSALALLVVFLPGRGAHRPSGHGPRIQAMADAIRAARAAVTLTPRDRLVLPGLALLNWLFDIACLAAVCAATGVSVGSHTVLLGYVAAKAAGVLALLPGGLGVTEVGMAATFAGAGLSLPAAAAVVAIYRLISYWAVLLVGWGAWLMLSVSGPAERREPRPSR
ncbi:lysylphosphatidylglycerol synthase transmembrane domain-containing protein [Sphaerisporangium aureirubrum]|uniref:YbhN family protein n=1 Tax=Sphaerisporangium aureirubrum TaxID=1544736 RepID=A0ABW1NAT8_9ACTN